MPVFQGFVGGTYQARSRVVSADRAVNLIPVTVEKDGADPATVFYSAPGKRIYIPDAAIFAPDPPISGQMFDDRPVRALFAQDGRAFAVVGGIFAEITPDAVGGPVTTHGTVAVGPEPATISSNGQGGHQLFITSGGEGYIFDLASDVFTPITAAGFPTYAVMGLFVDGYFLALEKDGIRFQYSDIFDGLSWDPNDAAVRSLGSDNWLAAINLQRQVWLLGSVSSIAYYQSGAADEVFQPIPGAYMSFGIEAPFSAAELDNTGFWLGRNKDGAGMVIKAQGSSPVRVSTDALEHLWRGYARRDDAIGYAYQEEGRTFYVLTFPTADATFVYDVSTGLWHERGRWSTARGEYGMDRSCCHCYAFGKHLVGDPEAGTIYEQSLAYHDDNLGPLRRMRRAPHIRQDGKTVFYSRFELDAETGIGTDLSAAPVAMLRYSNDGGRTWSDERRASLGARGAFRTRVVWDRLGSARDRVFEVAIADAVPVTVVGASLEAHVGTS